MSRGIGHSWLVLVTVLGAALARPAGTAAQPASTAAQPAALVGDVVDASGAAIRGATVVLLPAEGAVVPEVTAVTDDTGRFSLPWPAPSADVTRRLTVSADGFAPFEQRIADPGQPVHLVLTPAPVFESVNVTSSRTETPRADPTVTVSIVSAAELEARAAVTIDDALKLVPGFTLFRRTSSRVSNPTAQGVTLRGLGGTGSSRSLVLADGLPLNDAFGGWVYWDKVPQAAIDRIEVLRGSGSDLYGADAVGGVIQILTRRPGRLGFQTQLEAGSLGTSRVSAFAGARPRGWSYTAAGEWFQTDGYILVAPDQRGPVDVRAGSDHRSLHGSFGRQSNRGWRADAGFNVFSEDRRNGTPAVYNATASRYGWADVAGGWGGGLVSARVYGGSQGYDQSFSAVTLDRTSEDLNRLQRIPTTVFGVGGQWVRPLGSHALLIGAETKFIDGRTQETRIAQGVTLAVTDDGGRQRTGSLFVQDTWNAAERLTVVFGLHADGWHTEANNTPYDKTLGALNPRVSAAYTLSPSLSIRGSAYGGFRAPTLNELYRGFRTGNTQVNPNESLRPERLTGGDWGLVFAHRRASVRATAFWNRLDDVITNVTLSRTPTLITQQRQNADRVRSAGVELEAGWQVGAWSATATAALMNVRFKGTTAVRDNRVPQVPRSQFGLDVRYSRGGWTGSGQLRVTGEQFEDDLNLLPLRRATVVDVLASRRVQPSIDLFAAVENLFDEVYDVGRTPFLTVGLPRTVRAGLRFSWR